VSKFPNFRYHGNKDQHSAAQLNDLCHAQVGLQFFSMTFYRAMLHRARLSHSMSSVHLHPSVCPWRSDGCWPLCRFHTFLESDSLPVTAVTLPVTETAAAAGARPEGQRLVESGPSVLIGFVIGINRN